MKPQLTAQPIRQKMNCQEAHLPELELSTCQVREALQCLLHTILFVRAPGPVTPYDCDCENFNLTYSKIGKIEDVDRQVDESIEKFMLSLKPIGPELSRGDISLSFFERRVTKQLFGLVSNEERIIWEVWNIPVLVNSTPRPVNDDTASVIERQRIQDTAETIIRDAILKIFANASAGIDHVPPVMYEFQIKVVNVGERGGKGSGDKEERENVYARVANMPALINLSS